MLTSTATLLIIKMINNFRSKISHETNLAVVYGHSLAFLLI